VPTGTLRAGTSISMSSEDDRAVTELAPNGALVNMSIPVGEPNSVSVVGNDQILFTPGGFPSCSADLRAQTVRCIGLVPGTRYAVTRGRRRATKRARADGNGTLRVGGFPGSTGIRGGDLLTLRNGALRTLSTLHVAHLRVDLRGTQTVIAGGSCEPGDYWGPPLSKVPVGIAVGFGGLGGTGRICPPSGRAAGLPTSDIAQADDFSGGQTLTRVPDIESTTPLNGETLYGVFIAIAQAGLPGPHGSVVPVGPRVALTITPAGGGPPAFSAGNVDTPSGATVSGLAPGAYTAKWVLHDAAGDTRTITTRLYEEL
jgi:hypothetical protein